MRYISGVPSATGLLRTVSISFDDITSPGQLQSSNRPHAREPGETPGFLACGRRGEG